MTDHPDALRPAAQYLRVSTPSQNRSLPGQRQTIAAYAQADGYTIVETYEDAGRSGTTARGREGLARLMSDVLSGEARFKTILVLDVSRWGRYQDPDEAAHYEFLCRSAGINVRYCAEAFEEGPTASIMKQLKRVMAGEYSRELSAKVVRSKRRLEQLGHSGGGAAAYGIQRREVKGDGSPGALLPRMQRKGKMDYGVELVPGPLEEQVLCRRIFTLFVKGRHNPTAIARLLNRAGETWHDGTAWTASRVWDVLRCDLLVGRQLRGRTSKRLGGELVRRPPEAWRLAHRFKPVVPPALYKAARDRRADLRGGVRTRNDLLDDLRMLLAEHGTLSSELLKRDKRVAGISSYVREFGSLVDAYPLAGFHYTRRVNGGSACREDVLKRLKAMGAGHGAITMDLLRGDPQMPSTYMIKTLFGSVRAACDAASVTLGPPGGDRRPGSGKFAGSSKPVMI